MSSSGKEWIAEIKRYQSLNENGDLYVCDLHFNPNDITKNTKKTILRKNAVPSIPYVSHSLTLNKNYYYLPRKFNLLIGSLNTDKKHHHVCKSTKKSSNETIVLVTPLKK